MHSPSEVSSASKLHTYWSSLNSKSFFYFFIGSTPKCVLDKYFKVIFILHNKIFLIRIMSSAVFDDEPFYSIGNYILGKIVDN